MNSVRYVEINANEAGQRVDNYLMRLLKGVPKSHIYRLIRQGEVRVNKKRVRPAFRLLPGDQVRIPPVRMTGDRVVFVSDKFNRLLQEAVLFEDNQLLVLNKPAGIAVHGGSGLNLGVIEALRQSRSDSSYLELVHRLDKETSGCLLIAKKRSVLRAIQDLLASRRIQKIYWALLLYPWVGKPRVTVTCALEKNRLQSGERMVVVNEETGKASHTEFKLMENFKEACWVEAFPKTGRTHQIRVHAAHLGHPVAGDQKYGMEEAFSVLNLKPRLYLHARAIQFTLNDIHYEFHAEPDVSFTQAFVQLRSGR